MEITRSEANKVLDRAATMGGYQSRQQMSEKLSGTVADFLKEGIADNPSRTGDFDAEIGKVMVRIKFNVILSTQHLGLDRHAAEVIFADFKKQSVAKGRDMAREHIVTGLMEEVFRDF